MGNYAGVGFGSSSHQCPEPDNVSTIYAESGERFHSADKQDRRLLIPRKVLPIEGVAGLLFPLREKYREVEMMSMNHTRQTYCHRFFIATTRMDSIRTPASVVNELSSVS